MKYVMDTNIWIRLLRKENNVRSAVTAALSRGDQILLTSIVYFELLRGLQKRNDTQSIDIIKKMLNAQGCAYQECSRPIWDAAINLWVEACQQNKAREDADIVIAAFAKHMGATVVTDNTKHFSHLGVHVETWN